MSSPRIAAAELTGRKVFLLLVGFFVLIAIVDAILVTAATSTFGGLETASSYRVGLAFNRELEAAATQDERRWSADGRLHRVDPGTLELEMDLRDFANSPVSGVLFEARLEHPADRRLDRVIEMHEIAPGRFKGRADVARGIWTLVIAVSRGTESLFRSTTRIGPI
jgi:nitrogen fixation protein FixH